MRQLFLILLVLVSRLAYAQRGYDWRTRADMLVERADSLSLKSQRSFYLNRVIKVDKTFKNDKTVRETWYYTISEGKIPIFQVRYLLDSTEYNETFYLNNGSLVCYEKYETDFFSKYDEMNWGKVLFFENNNLKLHVSVGHHKSKEEDTTAGDVVEIFNKKYTELLRNLRLNGVKRL
jgi:hypothetical protein